MGEAELDKHNKQVSIVSHIITYGDAASEGLTQLIREEIETMWNEAQGQFLLGDETFGVQFRITAETKKRKAGYH